MPNNSTAQPAATIIQNLYAGVHIEVDAAIPEKSYEGCHIVIDQEEAEMLQNLVCPLSHHPKQCGHIDEKNPYLPGMLK